MTDGDGPPTPGDAFKGADAATDAAETAVDMVGAPNPTQQSGGSTSILSLLLETEPPGDPSDYPNMSDSMAHAVIGTKKVLFAATGADASGGTTAAENYIMAGLAAVKGRGGDGGDDADTDPSGLTGLADTDPDGGVGGEGL